MNNPYDLHALSTPYRQEAIAEVRMIPAEGWLRKIYRALSGQSAVSLALTNVLSLMRGS
jgi:hypothetical protein